MLVQTEIGLYTLVGDEQDPDRVRVGSLNPGALQAARDGIALVDGGEDPETVAGTNGLWIAASRHAVAEWLAHEVRQYVTTGRFEDV